jgi:hypothetical protein
VGYNPATTHQVSREETVWTLVEQAGFQDIGPTMNR